MGFSADVSERALVDCGRCCCLCHKFCGFKIELHHIIQKADGGEDSYENCIPLCFNCHADVKAYNPRHPKGKKYTESELKRHRDVWYKRRSETPAFDYNEKHQVLDKELFKKLVELLNLNSFIRFIKTHSFTNSFNQSSLEAMDRFLYYWGEPEYEFIDAEIETVRAELYDLMKKFSHEIACNTFPLGNGKFSIPDEWSWKFEERYKKTVLDLDTKATLIYEKYVELVRLGREKLAIRILKDNSVTE